MSAARRFPSDGVTIGVQLMQFHGKQDIYYLPKGRRKVENRACEDA